MKEPILSINFKLGFHSFFLQSREVVISDYLPFSQTMACEEAKSYPKLNKFIFKYQGLCELICNYVLFNDLLGNGTEEQGFLIKKI